MGDPQVTPMNTSATSACTPPNRRSAQGVSRRRRKLYLGLLALLAIIAVAVFVVQPWLRGQIRAQRARTLLQSLDSPDPQERKRAAWQVAERVQTTVADKRLIPRLRDRMESDPDVRESFVYALGRLGRRSDAPVLAQVARQDPSGYVRQAAWLAFARVDAEQFRDTAAQTAARDEWDRLGLAEGRLSVGETRAVGDLLDFAESGDAAQRVIAARSLQKGLRPLLETAGRWPVNVSARPGEPWPAEFVAEIRQRCAALDLQHIFDDSRRHIDDAHELRRKIGRVTGARERVRRLLYGG